MFLLKNIAFSANSDKRMKSIDSIETYAYGTSRDLINKKEEMKMTNFDDVTKENTKEHNPNWP